MNNFLTLEELRADPNTPKQDHLAHPWMNVRLRWLETDTGLSVEIEWTTGSQTSTAIDFDTLAVDVGRSLLGCLETDPES